jgi:CDP-2,3-bis-(O-geranylgeranyl)-sn-glycerol synthase
MGFGALLGDAIESFFKRQARVKPGNTWFPFDQIDYIIGGLLFSLPVITLGVKYYFLILVVWLLLHLISSYIGYLLGLKTKPI